MELEIWSLSGSHFHFGEQGLGQENTRAFWSSDSFFSALIARLAILQGSQAVEQWMQPFLAGKPPFLLTSLYPYVADVLFFPVPLAATLPDGKLLPPEIRPKELKGVQFVSEQLFRQFLKGETLADLHRVAVKMQGGKVWLTSAEYKNLPARFRKSPEESLWAIEKIPHVTVDRISNRGSLFHVAAVHFAPYCGLWFGVEWVERTPFHQDHFGNLLIELGEAGLGAERSVGYGKAEFKPFGSLTFSAPKTAWVALSRYLPRSEEMEGFAYQRAAWKVQTVAGWVVSWQKSGQRRRRVNLIQEGATLGVPLSSRPPFGQIVDIRPRYASAEQDPLKHAVYRCGLTVAVDYGGEG